MLFPYWLRPEPVENRPHHSTSAEMIRRAVRSFSVEQIRKALPSFTRPSGLSCVGCFVGTMLGYDDVNRKDHFYRLEAAQAFLVFTQANPEASILSSAYESPTFREILHQEVIMYLAENGSAPDPVINKEVECAST